MKIDWKKTGIIVGAISAASTIAYLIFRYEKQQAINDSQNDASNAEYASLEEENNADIIASLPTIENLSQGNNTVASTGTVDSGDDTVSSPTSVNTVDPSVEAITSQFAALASPISASLPTAASVTVLPITPATPVDNPSIASQPTGNTGTASISNSGSLSGVKVILNGPAVDGPSAGDHIFASGYGNNFS
jgi:hypothetical protein